MSFRLVHVALWWSLYQAMIENKILKNAYFLFMQLLVYCIKAFYIQLEIGLRCS